MPFKPRVLTPLFVHPPGKSENEKKWPHVRGEKNSLFSERGIPFSENGTLWKKTGRHFQKTGPLFSFTSQATTIWYRRENYNGVVCHVRCSRYYAVLKANQKQIKHQTKNFHFPRVSSRRYPAKLENEKRASQILRARSLHFQKNRGFFSFNPHVTVLWDIHVLENKNRAAYYRVSCTIGTIVCCFSCEQTYKTLEQKLSCFLAFKPRVLTPIYIHQVSSKMERWSHFQKKRTPFSENETSFSENGELFFPEEGVPFLSSYTCQSCRRGEQGGVAYHVRCSRYHIAILLQLRKKI